MNLVASVNSKNGIALESCKLYSTSNRNHVHMYLGGLRMEFCRIIAEDVGRLCIQ
jgi:hypothetical protein